MARSKTFFGDTLAGELAWQEFVGPSGVTAPLWRGANPWATHYRGVKTDAELYKGATGLR